MLLLDSSGSMAANVSDGQKMDLAKSALENFASNLPKQSKVTLRVFGHKGTGGQSDKGKSCQSTETFYSLSNYDKKQFDEALSKFQPSGWTPLALGIKKTKQDLENTSGSKKAENLVFIVSDGIETCGGDPITAAKSLHKSNIEAVVNIIGFDVSDKGQQQLKSVANTGGGDYKTVKTKEELQKNMDNWGNLGLWSLGATTTINIDLVSMVQELLDIRMEFTDLRDREQKIMKDALQYLQKKKRITNEQSLELYDKIDNRAYGTGDYVSKIHHKKDDMISKKYDKIIERLKKGE